VYSNNHQPESDVSSEVRYKSNKEKGNTMSEETNTESNGIVWAEPGPVTRVKVNRTSKYQRIAAELLKNPGRFGIVAEADKEANARRIAHAAQRNIGGWRDGEFKAQVRRKLDSDGNTVQPVVWQVFVKAISSDTVHIKDEHEEVAAAFTEGVVV